MKIRKSTFRIVGMVVILVAILGIASLVMADDTVNIVTTPIKLQEPIYLDENADGVHDANEFVGNYDVYDGNLTITFNWLPYAFAEGANGSYRVSLVQNVTPLGPEATWSEIVVGHHWADNPNGTTYVMGPFSPHTTCTYCPSHFVVQPETYEQVMNADTGAYEYVYTPVAAALGGTALTLEESEDFTLEIFYLPDNCADGINCREACSTYSNCLSNCAANDGCDPDVACDNQQGCKDFCNDDGFGKAATCVPKTECRDAWEIYCAAVTDNNTDFQFCLSDYDEAVNAGFCEVCGDNPLSCAGGPE